MFEILYRQYGDTRTRLLRVPANDDQDAVRALTVHVGGFHYVVVSLRRS